MELADNQSDLPVYLRGEIARAKAVLEWASRPGDTWPKPNLALWESSGKTPWIEEEEILAQPAGLSRGQLWFAYPLTGNFEFMFEARDLGGDRIWWLDIRPSQHQTIQ